MYQQGDPHRCATVACRSYEDFASFGTILLLDWDGVLCAIVDSEAFNISGTEVPPCNASLAHDHYPNA